jgi:CheY-like chemotaxis protein
MTSLGEDRRAGLGREFAGLEFADESELLRRELAESLGPAERALFAGNLPGGRRTVEAHDRENDASSAWFPLADVSFDNDNGPAGWHYRDRIYNNRFTRLKTPGGLLDGLTVLVVEDEFLIALDAQRVIEDAGAGTVLLANSTGDVRKLLADGSRIDASILDLKLGEEDATPLMEEFARRNIPFLVTTGLDASVPAGVRILPKPYRDAEFIDAILELVHRKQ